MEDKTKVTDAKIVSEAKPNDTKPETKNDAGTPAETPKTAEATPVTPAAAPKTDTTATPSTPKEKSGSWPWLPFIAGMLVALIGWQVYSIITKEADTSARGPFPEVVATINGEAVTGEELQASVSQTEALAFQQGIDPADETARLILVEQALEVITNTKLLIQAARTAGVTASGEDVDVQISAIEAQFGGAEGLAEQAAALGLSNDDLRQDIEEQLIVDEYIRTETGVEDITVSDEEIQEVYDGLVEAGQEMPPLADVRDGIEAQILGQKQQTAVLDLVEQLKTEAEIEILI